MRHDVTKGLESQALLNWLTTGTRTTSSRARKIARWLRDFCVFGSALLCPRTRHHFSRNRTCESAVALAARSIQVTSGSRDRRGVAVHRVGQAGSSGLCRSVRAFVLTRGGSACAMSLRDPVNVGTDDRQVAQSRLGLLTALRISSNDIPISR